MSLAFADTLIVRQQRGPTLTVTICVLAIQGTSNTTANSKDKVETETITMDDSVEVFFKFRWIEVNKKTSLDIYTCVRNKKTVENSAVGLTITFEELKLKRYVQCTNTLIEIPLGNVGWTSRKELESVLSTLLYKLDITITIKESSMNNRLYQDMEFTDFQLQTSDGSVAVHKAILSIHSDMFKTMLRGEWKETAEGRITMDGVTVQTLQHLKDYMYLGTLPDEGLEPLLLLAEHYLMEKLKADCIAKLVTSVKPENFEGILQFACQGSAFTELVRALIFQVPENVLNAVQELQINT